MKILATIVITLMSLCFTVLDNNNSITVTVVNVNSSEGTVVFGLYNKTNFLKEPIQGKIGNIVDGKSTIVFENVAPGEYAITCFHDKNNNGIMDFEPNGLPKENYGASNNVMSFGPPQYLNAKFEVLDKNVSLDIKF